MNAATGTKEWVEGYRAYEDRTPCPYDPGSTERMLWLEGLADCHEDLALPAELPPLEHV